MEEEIFNYQTLRYILDKNGYVCHASLGGFISCDLGECTEYTGAIPNGYSTIEDWYEEELETLNAWKIVDGNLAFDPNRYETLRLKCEKEHEDNRYVCHKEISNLTNLVKSDNAYNYLTSETDTSKLLEVTDSNKFASTHIEITPNQHLTNKVHIKFNNGNLLTNDATPKNVSGIYFVVNPDRTIYMSGIATNDIEYDIGGYSNNTKPILAFKKGINYYLSSNGYQIKMYYFDGTDRNEIYSGNGGVINFTDDDRKVTQIVLFIPNGTNTNASISPMLNVGDTAKEYIAYEGNTSIVYLGEYSLEKDSYIEIDNGIALIQGGDPIYLDSVEMPSTYLDLTYMYCMEDLNLKVIYPNTQRNNDLTGYETPNGAFAIDEEGNMYCNNATINGSAIVNGSNFSVDEDGNLKATSGEIAGFNISEEGLYYLLQPKADYTEEDITRLSNHIYQGGTLTNEEKELYDINNDGVLNLVDIMQISWTMQQNISNSNPGKFQIKIPEVGKNPFALGFGLYNGLEELVNGFNYNSSTLQNLNVTGELKLNDTKIIPKNILCAYLNTGKTVTTGSDQRAIIPLDVYDVVGNKLTFDSSSNAIVIGEGVKKILIRASIGYTHDASQLLGINIMRNTTGQAGQKLYSAYGVVIEYAVMDIETICSNVSEGDIIQLAIRSVAKTNHSVKIDNGRGTTSLIVEVIE